MNFTVVVRWVKLSSPASTATARYLNCLWLLLNSFLCPSRRRHTRFDCDWIQTCALPISAPAERAVKMAVAMREAARELIAAWSRHGCELGFGVGIAQGFATLGQIGFSERSGYTAIGTVCNLAARLCAEAKDGQILISSRIAEAGEGG